MKYTLPIVTSLAFMGAASAQNVLISEVDSNQPGTDTAEFVELVSVDASGNPVGGVSLDGFVLVNFNGGDDLSRLESIDLDGQVTNADGLFVVGNSGVNGVGELTFAEGYLQNGAEAVALYIGDAADFPAGTPVTTENLMDAVVFASNDAQDDELLSGLAPEGVTLTQFDERFVNGQSGTANPNLDGDSVARIPDGGTPFSNNYSIVPPTPGLLNTPSNAFTLNLGATSVSENGAALTGSVSISTALDDDLVVDLFNDDVSELEVPLMVTIPAGTSTATFVVTPVNDLWDDGDRPVNVTASTAVVNITPVVTGIDVIDDDDASTTVLVINEISADVFFDTQIDPLDDANGDGVGDQNDEFVEIVNSDPDNSVDISGFMLGDRTGPTHTFPAGTILEPSCAIVVFSGGAPEGRLPQYGGAISQNANEGVFGLSLNDTGDSIRIINVAGDEVIGYDYVDEEADDLSGSLTRDPDVTGDFIDDAGEPQFTSNLGDSQFFITPGFRNDGVTPFCDLGQLIAIFDPVTISEDGGTSTLTITRTGSTDATLDIVITNSDETEISVPAVATFAVGESSVDIDVVAVNDEIPDGTIAVSVTATAENFISGIAEIMVEDDGDVSPIAVVINEVDANTPGNDTAEFVELFDGGVGNTDLSDLALVFYNGSGLLSYRSVSLEGLSTNASGFLVIGSDSVTGAVGSLPDNAIQNGPDAIALVFGSASAFPTGSGFPSLASVVDAIVYNGAAPDLATGLGVTPVDEAPSDSDVESIQRSATDLTPRDTSSFFAASPTPNAANTGGPTIVEGSAAFEAFAAANGITGSPVDDDDGDGIPNAVEFAIAGFGPGTTDAIPVPVDNILSIAKSTEAGADPDTTIVIEVSTDLINFSTTDTAVITDDATSLVVEFTGDSPRAFFRVNVTTVPSAQ